MGVPEPYWIIRVILGFQWGGPELPPPRPSIQGAGVHELHV